MYNFLDTTFDTECVILLIIKARFCFFYITTCQFKDIDDLSSSLL